MGRKTEVDHVGARVCCALDSLGHDERPTVTLYQRPEP